ncbi:hypothetical protein E4T56_gene18898 [Termitomyces sp. T112]|nr:hypothetical protein E4T56_gene18898 [Termitomyces sp. T112]
MAPLHQLPCRLAQPHPLPQPEQPHRLQAAILDSDISHPGASTSGAAQTPSTSNSNPDEEGSATPPQSPSIKLQWLPSNIPQNQYKGPQYPDQQHSKPPTNSATTPDSTATTPTSNSVASRSLNIKIISTAPFACLLQDGTPTFQLQIMPALLEEHLCAGTTVPESKTEGQILSEVVPPEYHEFADMFSEGSAKELPPHHSYNHKIDLKEGTSPLFGKINNMSEIKLWALKEYLDDMLQQRFYMPINLHCQHSSSVCQEEGQVTLTLCGYWGLNKVTKKNRYPLPLIRDLVDCLCSAKIYTKIDLCSSYNNVWIAPGHE